MVFLGVSGVLYIYILPYKNEVKRNERAVCKVH